MILESVLTAVVTVIIGVTVYAFSQIILKLIIEPVHKQDEIRSEIAHFLTYYSNVYSNPGLGTPQHTVAVNKFRQLAALLISRTFLIRKYWFFSWIGLVLKKSDILKAHSSLIALSNSINLRNYAKQNVHRAEEIRKLLKI